MELFALGFAVHIEIYSQIFHHPQAISSNTTEATVLDSSSANIETVSTRMPESFINRRTSTKNSSANFQAALTSFTIDTNSYTLYFLIDYLLIII